MSENKRRFKVEIDGEQFTIIGKSTPEHMDAVMGVANHELATIKKMMPSLSEKKAALLLAINAVSDQLEKQEELDRLKQSMDK
ncbi:MAG TPA: cell division protein ZapA [Candidatus Ligilactobacillus excrementigallinarum]|uniref:Cell division protein ZapA n=1 Tax=Candidatus Ligilactobacillus excrementigallinarum TaxID=2838641 RepID=A0A9D2A951_9LACO|nr:cell division protein ZapA [Candidatus Ligilactobacillus excrementigallinarum]